MSSEQQLTRWCSKYPWFSGVYAANELPDPATLPRSAAIIVNYLRRDEAGGRVGHWVAIGRINDPVHPPFWCDSFGFGPDELDNILNVSQTNFRSWMERLGSYVTNTERFQCVKSDFCGQYACWAVKCNAPPQTSTGAIRPSWKAVFDSHGVCERSDAAIQRLVKLSDV